MTLGKRIKGRMDELNIRQVDLAKNSGITQQVISQYTRDISKPGYNSLLGLARGLEVPIEWFFADADIKFEAPERSRAENDFGYCKVIMKRTADDDELRVAIPIGPISYCGNTRGITIGNTPMLAITRAAEGTTSVIVCDYVKLSDVESFHERST